VWSAWQLATTRGESQRVAPGSQPHAPSATHTGLVPPHDVVGSNLPFVQRWRVAPPEQRWSPSRQTQAPAEQTGASPLQAGWLTQAWFSHRCGVEPLQRTAPFVQPQVPIPRHTGVSPVHASRLTQPPFTQRWGVFETQRVVSSIHAQRPVSGRHTGVAPLHGASSW
jgi:hypothetical protein